METNLKSEFESKGINQTLHRMYLELECRIIILTPYETIEEEITNQLLLAEAVIIGTTPDTFFDLSE